MGRVVLYLLSTAMLMTAGCEHTVRIPVRTETVAVSVSVDELICHVRTIAKEQRLGFRYGTFFEGTEEKATIRLVGKAFELSMQRWDGRPEYEIRAYDMSNDAGVQNLAVRSLEKFTTTLMDRLPGKCMV